MSESIDNVLNSISLKDFISYCMLVIGFVTLVVEKSKNLPFNPWTSLFRWIGNRVNAPTLERLDDLEDRLDSFEDRLDRLEKTYETKFDKLDSKIDNLERNEDEKEARRLRSNIINFSDSCRIGVKHTKKNFENVFRDYSDYVGYCKRHNLKNHYIDEEKEYIHKVYTECLEENKFL